MRTAKQNSKKQSNRDLTRLLADINDALNDDFQDIYLYMTMKQEEPTFLNPDNGKELSF